MNLSFCIPVYNEEQEITRSVPVILKTLPKLGIKKFEILLIDNGSTDRTYKTSKIIKDKRVKIIKIKEKGLGLALKKGIESSTYENIFFTGIDLPFGFSDLSRIVKIGEKFDIIFGSKKHPESVLKRRIARTVSSSFYGLALRLLFRSQILDPQGSIFMKKKKILSILPNLNSKNYFFTTQIAIYGQLNNLNMTEIPIRMKGGGRPSKVNILSDGFSVLTNLILEFMKIQKTKLNLSRDLTNKITSFMDSFVPPFIRDSKFIMSPVFSLLFREQATLFMTFKEKAPFLSEKEFAQIYRKVNKVAVFRKTDLNNLCIKGIQEEAKGKTILEVGCGKAYLSNLLSSEFKVTASDIAINKKFISMYPNLTFVEANAENLPFKNKSFDTVICTHTLEHVLDFEKAVEELRRVTRNKLIIVVPKQRQYKYTFDLHLNFFPYKETLLLALHTDIKNSKCVELNHDLLFVEDCN